MQFCCRVALLFTVLSAVVNNHSPIVLGYPTNSESGNNYEVGSTRTLQGLQQGATQSTPSKSPSTRSVPLTTEEYQPHPEYTVAIARPRLPPLQELNESEEKLQGDGNNRDKDIRLKRSNQNKDEAEPDDDMLTDETEIKEDDEDAYSDAQHFFPSFTPLFSAPPPLGHSRPPYYNQESAYSQRPTFPGGFRDLSYPQAVAESESNTNVLGSGNFGVIRGGTYYAEERDDLLNDDLYSSYYHGNNGHGRPAYYRRNPPPPFRQGDDFFANFRDFADISTPTKSSYSHYYVVYVNRNATNADTETNQVGSMGSRQQSIPHNIIEQLQLIDSTTETPNSKLSKTKKKLEKYKQTLQKKEEKKTTKSTISPKELYEPLLALS
ncbi:uncharacterized protein LOC142324514 isoform X2 [Lycorma delicatula]|uniref:uncharacterized protein LOC142324514 isoform X2 n=1 Tax=Lycorma delicatula TaxID=130591 RepID=UPI003F51435F